MPLHTLLYFSLPFLPFSELLWLYFSCSVHAVLPSYLGLLDVSLPVQFTHLLLCLHPFFVFLISQLICRFEGVATTLLSSRGPIHVLQSMPLFSFQQNVLKKAQLHVCGRAGQLNSAFCSYYFIFVMFLFCIFMYAS